jgi:hypothetical protein
MSDVCVFILALDDDNIVVYLVALCGAVTCFVLELMRCLNCSERLIDGSHLKCIEIRRSWNLGRQLQPRIKNIYATRKLLEGGDKGSRRETRLPTTS